MRQRMLVRRAHDEALGRNRDEDELVPHGTFAEMIGVDATVVVQAYRRGLLHGQVIDGFLWVRPAALSGAGWQALLAEMAAD